VTYGVIMKDDEINKALWEYYRVVTEEAKNVGTQKIRVFTSSIMCMALFLTFIGLLMTQTDKIVFSFNLITIGIVVIGIILFLFFLSFMGYYLFLRIHNNNIFVAAMKIEKLQRDILFEKISQEELQERFELVYPFLNASKYEIKMKNLFYPKRK
jgi:ACR3 family arsenite efflux pump ArsB